MAQVPATLSSVSLRAEDDVLRVALDMEAGALGVVNLNQGEGFTELSVEIKGTTAAELTLIAESLKKYPEVTFYEVLPGLADRSVLLIRFAKTLGILDETVVAYGEGRSRWEIVLDTMTARAEPAALANEMPVLGALDFGASDSRLDLFLNGNSTLQAEVSLSDDSMILNMDLPSISLDYAKEAIRNVLVMPAPIDKIYAEQIEGGARLVYRMSRPVDIVDTSGVAFGPSGVVSVTVVPDATPRVDSTPRLISIKTVDSVNGVSLALQGVTSQEQTTYFLDGPPRLVVDLLGWQPEQVKVAAEKFASEHDVIRAVAATDTRLGSARLVFSLTTPLSLAGVTQSTNVHGLQGALQLALAPVEVNTLSMASLGVDFGSRRDLQNLRSPEIIIKPVQLLGDYAKKDIEPSVGNVFRMMDLVMKGKERDPRYRSALLDYQIAYEQTVQAKAGYKPTISVDAQKSKTFQDLRVSPNPSFQQLNSQFTGHSYNLTITQPIVRVQNFVRIQQTDVLLEQAQLELAAAEQDLLLRLAGSYLNLLAAADGMDLARAEKLAVGKQLDLTRSRLQAGLGTQAQLYDTEARYSLTVAREIEAVNRLDDSKAALREIVGEEIADVKGFKRDFLAVPPRPAKIDNWVRASVEQNLTLRSKVLASLVAEKEIQRQRAGHYPTLDAVATHGRQVSSDTLFGGPQDISTSEISARLSVPIYNGGAISSLVREAIARKDQAVQSQEEELRKTERTTRAAFLGVQASVSSLDALRKNVIAQESALKTKLEGFKVGIQSVVTVVDAYRLFFSARRDYLQSRYDYLINRLRLKQSVGSLAQTDIEQLATLLE